MIHRTWFFAVAATLLLGAVAGHAQSAPDLVAVDVTGKRLLALPRTGGAVTTFQTLDPQLAQGPLIAGPGDDSVFVISTYFGGINRHYLERVDVRGASTLATFMIIPEVTVDMGLDDAGDLLLLTKYNHAQNGLYTAPIGSSTVHLTAAWPSQGAAEAVAFTEDLDTGDWWVMDESAYLHRLPRGGGAVLSLARVSTGTLTAGDLTMDPLTGGVVVAAGHQVLEFDPVTRAVTTLYTLPFPLGGSEAMGLHFDQTTRGFVLSGWQAAGPATYGVIAQLDSAGQFVRIDRLGINVKAENVTAVWGRAFTPLSAPIRGTTYRLGLRAHTDVGKPYVAALALGTRPGLALPGIHLPLNPDPLFFLSLQGAPIFRGFAGLLDSTGGAALAIDLPASPALKGVRIAAAAVVIDGGAFRRVLGPFVFSIR